MYCIVKRDPPRFITYNYEKKFVSVVPAADYEGALDIAQKEYPKLAKVSRDRIIFSVPIYERKTDKNLPLRISPDAWSATIDSAHPGQVVTIDVLPMRKGGLLGFRRVQSEEPVRKADGNPPLEPSDASITSTAGWKSWFEKEKSPRNSIDSASQ